MYEFLGNTYKIVSGNDNFNYEEIKSLFTEYFLDYDYVLGDYSYGRVRLKGFYKSDNKFVKEVNDIKNLEQYINNFCSFGAKIVLLEKENIRK